MNNMTLQEARQKLPLDLLMAHLGHHEAARPKAHSPFREDKNASFGIYRSEDGRLRWKDHSTGDGGDEVDYLAHFYGVSPAEATKRFLELAGNGVSVPAPESALPCGKYRVKKKGLVDSAASADSLPKRPPVFAWSEFVARADDKFLAAMAKERGLSVEVFRHAVSLGLIGATGDAQPAFVVNGGSACHYRVADASWRYEPRGAQTQPLCFGNEAALDAWVFESQWDALAVLDAVGVERLSSVRFVVTRGANNGKLAAGPCDGKRVVAWPQNDAAKGGKVPSDEWLRDVRACTNSCRVVRVPGHFKDANDWVESLRNAGGVDGSGCGGLAGAVDELVSAAVLPELVGIEVFTPAALMKFRPEEDESALLGDRWICRGGACLLVGPSGIGKSSLAAQMAVMWALGLPAFGIAPKRPLKSIFVQAENDEGDMAEMVQGVYFYACTEASKRGWSLDKVRELLRENLIFARDTIHSGEKFGAAADALAGLHKPDLFWCDPLLSYVGDDIASQRVASGFLRGLLNPISFRHGFAWMMVHHTGKPPGDAKARQKWTDTDFSYIGLGSSELTNWARACLYLESLDDGIFALRLTKRGKRAGVVTESGFPIFRIGLQHGEKHICWEPCELPEDGEKAGTITNLQIDEILLRRAGGESLSKIIAAMDLKNSKGTAMGKGQLCKILTAHESKKGAKYDG
jgi:hypothetical protein